MLHFPCDIYFCISLNLDAIFFLNTVHFKTKNLSLVSRFTDRGINPPAYILSVPRTFCPSPIHFVPLLYILSLPHVFCPSPIHFVPPSYIWQKAALFSFLIASLVKHTSSLFASKSYL